MNETHRLLQEFVQEGSDEAFRELVSRYIDLVYSTALRHMAGDAHRAQDVAQAVFIDLARKAAALPPNIMLGGWLHRHCGFVASNIRRGEQRRAEREQEAARMSAPDGEPGWADLAPVIDEAIQDLPEPDRDALIMRFFEKQDFRAIGAALGASDDAAQKRTSRALEKLRHLLAARGVALSLAALEVAMLANSVAAAPAALAGTMARSALEQAPVKAAAVGGLGALLFSSAGKVAMGVALAAVLLWQGERWFGLAAHRVAGAWDGAVQSRPEHAASAPELVPASTAAPIAAAAVPAEEDTATNVLRLFVVSAETGQPLLGVPIEYRASLVERWDRRNLVTDETGLCLAPVPSAQLRSLELTTRGEGYADTRLIWHPSRGQRVPERYTLKLRPATPISGRVVDASGDPVSGAEVGFNHDEQPVQATYVESPLFGWLTAETDAEGRWKINRVADEMVRALRGSAGHPDHVSSEYLTLSQEPGVEEQLRSGTHVFRLKPAVTLRGVVRESGGFPISGAKVLAGPRGMGGSREAKTDLDGSFELRGVMPGQIPVTAQAPQYAPTTRVVDAATNTGPVELVLEPGKILKLRVVNAAGQPVPNAYVWLNTMDHRLLPGEVTALSQASFSPRTDEDGRVMWDQAPDQELSFDIAAKGCMRASEIKIRPDGTEHTVVLQPGLTVKGTVRDAETQAPMEQFRMITGWPHNSGRPGERRATWSTIDRFWLSFAGGKFEHTFEEPVVGGVSDPEFVFKFEADGYRPHVTRAVKANEGTVTFDIALEKASTVEITVLEPDGRPAAQAELMAAAPMEQVHLGANGFQSGSMGARFTADGEGKVRWQPDDVAAVVYAANARGLAEKTVEDLRQDPVLRLQAWGEAEVIWTVRGKPVTGRRILVSPDNPRGDKPSLHISEPAELDAEGRAVLRQLPPGKHKLAWLKPMGGPRGSFRHAQFGEVEVRPGERTVLRHDENGAEVSVRVRWRMRKWSRQ
jgi:RNA polymerase sigma factor (sigma-70 family)